MQAEHEIQSLPLSRVYRSEDASLATGLDGEGGESKPKGGFKIRPLLAIVRRNLPMILGVTAIAGGVSFINYKNTPLIYEGDFRILVEPITSQGRATDPTAISRATQTTQDGSTVDYPTLLQVLQSPELLSKIAAQIQTQYPGITASFLERSLRNQDFTVSRIGTNMLDSTRALEVTYRGTDPKMVMFVLEKLAEGYLRFSLEDRKTRIGGGVEFIEDQLPGLQQRVTNLEAQLQAIRQRYRFTDPTIENQQVVDQLKEVQNRKLEAETSLREQATLFKSLQNQLRLTPEQGLAASALSQNPRFQDLLTQRQKVQSQIAVSLARFTEDSPSVQRLRGQEQNLNRLIAQEASSILGQSSPGVPQTGGVVAFQDPLRVGMITQLVTSGNQARALQARAAEIARTENELNQRLIELPAIVRQYNTLQQQLDIATKTLNQFLLQRETLRVEAAQKEVPWEIISKPNLASNPLTGKPIATRGKKSTQMLMAGVAGGLFIGLLAAFLREKLRNVFVTAEDLQDAVPQPFLASIPVALPGGGVMSGYSGKSANPFLDAFSTLYTNLRFLHTSGVVNSLAVSSVEMGDGKTTVALNLAQTAASMGQRVLLVDANLIAPQVHHFLEVSNQYGLVDVLQQKVTVDDVIHRSPLVDNLFVMPAGSVQIGSTKLFASSEMHRISKRLQDMFDLVIYDTPALGGVTDLNFLGAQTDGFLVVVGLNKTKRSTFNKTLESLNKYRIPVVGIIANHVNARKPSYPISQPKNIASTGMPSAFLGNFKGTSDVTR